MVLSLALFPALSALPPLLPCHLAAAMLCRDCRASAAWPALPSSSACCRRMMLAGQASLLASLRSWWPGCLLAVAAASWCSWGGGAGCGGAERGSTGSDDVAVRGHTCAQGQSTWGCVQNHLTVLCRLHMRLICLCTVTGLVHGHCLDRTAGRGTALGGSQRGATVHCSALAVAPSWRPCLPGDH